MRTENLIDAIGGTPLVRLDVPAADGVRVYAKLEMHNLFAMKDRVARNIIAAATARGELEPGGPIVESSSGTMALGVALVGTLLGHPVHIVTDPRIDEITLAKLRSLGCEVHIVAQMDDKGWQGARLTRLRELMTAHPGMFWPRQYDNPDNPAAYRTLAEELLADLDHIDVMVGSVGSGGSLCGSSRVLRQSLPKLRVVGVDCVGSVLFGQPDWPQRLQSGLGNSLHPPNLDHSVIDEVHWLSDHEAFAATRALAREQKLFAGNTSGSVYRVLTEMARRAAPGTTIVGILPDRGDRYVDTIYRDEYWAERGLSGPLPARARPVPAGTTVRSWSYVRTAPDAEPPVAVFVESNTTGTGMLALTGARRLGLHPVLLTDRPERYRGLAGTGATVLTCRTGEVPPMVDALREHGYPDHLIGAVTTTSEFYLVLAARLAAAVGLPGADPEAVSGCRDKGRLRAALAEAGVRQPAFAAVRDGSAAAEAAARIGLPCVVKPVDDSGSTGVRRCDTVAEAAAQAERVVAVTTNGRGLPTARTALVEQLLTGPEYSVEMFGLDGEQRLLGIVEKATGAGPTFVECRHIVPADLPESQARDIEDLVRSALAVAGVSGGPTHTEVKIGPDGPAIVEINPRLAGGMIPDLFRLAGGVDLVESQIRYAAGLPVTLPERLDGYAGIQFVLPAEAGTLVAVEGVEAASRVPGVERVTITVAEGAAVAPPTDAYGRIGHIIARGATREAVAEALDLASGLIQLKVG